MKTIVLVDDVQFNLTLLWHLVKRIENYNSVSFLKPEDALEWCKENEYDLVIVDYMMPKMNGIKFIEQLKAYPEKKDIPILMVTANDQLNVRYKALEAGANDFLTKPIDKTEFMIRVQNMLVLCQHYRHIANENVQLTHKVIENSKKINEREIDTICSLSKAAEYRDPETGGHIQRMSWYSKHIANQLNFSDSEQELILQAAPMHDVGKVGIPDAILLKPGRLDSTEFELMKEHSIIGYEILNVSSSPLMKIGAKIALTHHEKYDGSGYPYGLEGDDISIYGRIIAVADVFDALISSRPYKKPWPIENAIEFLKENSGKHFDPQCIDAFFKDWDHVLEIRDHFSDQ